MRQDHRPIPLSPMEHNNNNNNSSNSNRSSNNNPIHYINNVSSSYMYILGLFDNI